MDTEFIKTIENDYPEFRFQAGKRFAFRPPKTIVYEETGLELLLLHEVGHALLGHRGFETDVERLRMENEAWEKARELANRYRVRIDEETIQEKLESYREWLFKKSRCPRCSLSRYQAKNGEYCCPICDKNNP